MQTRCQRSNDHIVGYSRLDQPRQNGYTAAMHSPLRLFSLLACVVALPSLLAKPPAEMDTRGRVVSAPMPHYPYAARARYLQGQGQFRVHFDDKTGEANRVEITRSTGYNILDQAALDALRQWKVKPHTFEVINVPVNFSLEGLRATTVRNATEKRANGNILYAPWPHFPFAAAAHGVGGKGRFRLSIDPRTGLVTDVQILETTHDKRLDDSAAQTLRQWRFKPNTIQTFDVPIDFDLGYG